MSKHQFPALHNFGLHAYGSETVSSDEIVALYGNAKEVRLTAMAINPEIGGPAVTMLKEVHAWSPEVTRFNGITAEMNIIDPGPKREIGLVSLIHPLTGFCAAQVFWVDKDGTGEGLLELRVREYGGVDSERTVHLEDIQPIKIGQTFWVNLVLSKYYSLGLIVNGKSFVVDYLNRQSYKALGDLSFYYAVGLMIEEIEDGAAILDIKGLDNYHSDEPPAEKVKPPRVKK